MQDQKEEIDQQKDQSKVFADTSTSGKERTPTGYDFVPGKGPIETYK